MLARIWARPPSWSFRWNFTAPQQPASGATTVWMPAASSTRAVALLMLGIIAGCTQPASISTLRACVRVGQRAGVLPRRHLVASARAGSSAAHRLAQLHRRAEQRRGQAFLQRPAQRLRRPRRAAPCARRCRGRCRPGGRSRTPLGQVLSQLRQVRQRSRCSCVLRVGCLAFQHLLDQVDAAARAVELVAQQLVGGAGGGAEAAVHALAQDGLGLRAFGACPGIRGRDGSASEIAGRAGRG